MKLYFNLNEQKHGHSFGSQGMHILVNNCINVNPFFKWIVSSLKLCCCFSILQSTRDQIAHKREMISSYENHNNQTGKFTSNNLYGTCLFGLHWVDLQVKYEHLPLLAEEDEYYPKLSTKELAQHFEKTIEEAAPSKKIKVSPL